MCDPRIAGWLRNVAIGLLAVGAVWGGPTAWAEEEPFLRQARFNGSQTYYLYVPQRHTGNEPWPLFIVMHGGMASGIGDFNLWKQYADAEGFIVLAPNFSGEYYTFEGNTDHMLLKLVEEVDHEYRIDKEKILLSGFSWGGQFAYRFAMKYPTFAHTVVIFNSGNFPPPTRATRADRPHFYLAAGAEERIYPQQLPGVVAALKQAGYQVDSFIAPGVGHSIPSRSIVDVLELFRAMRGGRKN